MPSGARCELCRKTCGSSDVPAGVRCEWCGVQVGARGGASAGGAGARGSGLCRRTGSWVFGTARLHRAALRPLRVQGRLRSLAGGTRGGSAWSSAPEPRARAAPAALQAHSVCSAALAPECTFGRLRTLVLPPACVRLLSRNFSKMHCFRIPESAAPEPGERGGGEGWPARGRALTEAGRDLPAGDGEDSADGSVSAGPGREVGAPESGKWPLAVPAPTPRVPLPRTGPHSTDLHALSCGPGKQTLKIFDGSDAMQRNHFRVVTVPRLARSQEVLVRGGPAVGDRRHPQAWPRQAPPLLPSGRRRLCGLTTSPRTLRASSCRRSPHLRSLATPRLRERSGAQGPLRRRAAERLPRPGYSALCPAPRRS